MRFKRLMICIAAFGTATAALATTDAARVEPLEASQCYSFSGVFCAEDEYCYLPGHCTPIYYYWYYPPPPPPPPPPPTCPSEPTPNPPDGCP